MSKRSQPIGFFDSGVGGTSVWREFITMMPRENTVYLADSRNAPYGGKSRDEIIALSKRNTEFLLDQGAKLIVVACNTATTNAIQILRETYHVPFVGIEPAIKPAALRTATGHIGVLATRGTLASDLFARTTREYASDIDVLVQNGDGLVELIEAGKTHSTEMKELLKKYLTPMLEAGADHIILGCTHYPYIIPQIREITGDDIEIVDSGFAVSRQIRHLLRQFDLENTGTCPGEYVFYTNTRSNTLSRMLQDLDITYKLNRIESV